MIKSGNGSYVNINTRGFYWYFVFVWTLKAILTSLNLVKSKKGFGIPIHCHFFRLSEPHLWLCCHRILHVGQSLIFKRNANKLK